MSIVMYALIGRGDRRGRARIRATVVGLVVFGIGGLTPFPLRAGRFATREHSAADHRYPWWTDRGPSACCILAVIITLFTSALIYVFGHQTALNRIRVEGNREGSRRQMHRGLSRHSERGHGCTASSLSIIRWKKRGLNLSSAFAPPQHPRPAGRGVAQHWPPICAGEVGLGSPLAGRSTG